MEARETGGGDCSIRYRPVRVRRASSSDVGECKEGERGEDFLPFASNLALACSALGHRRPLSIGLEEPVDDSRDQQHLRRLFFPSIHLTQQQLTDLTSYKGGHTARE